MARTNLVAIVELAVALWLAATSGYLCLQLGVPQPVQLAGGQQQPSRVPSGGHVPASPRPAPLPGAGFSVVPPPPPA
ncbi:hypothetical protein GUJ93_ZPchr0006g45829 [Zizania palustris]|uniref:Uncharacterized protein n=1 Tax=Zizania palustris TaxID=103762 RepID=A0A8J5SE51_ZIZPA|nr:hypothetical protein GUJ93_ZPchr0006g45829 [Zizania palustris]